MPKYTIDVSDKVVALIAANAAALEPYGYDATLPDPIGALLYRQATEAIRGVLTDATAQLAMAKAQQQIVKAQAQVQALVDSAFAAPPENPIVPIPDPNASGPTNTTSTP